MWSFPVLAVAVVLSWVVVLTLLLRAVPRSAWPAVLIGSGATLLAGALAAAVKYPSWEALLLLVGAPVIAVAVTAGRPALLLDPKWTLPPDEITDEAEERADRYAWRAVLVVIAAVVFGMITFGW